MLNAPLFVDNVFFFAFLMSTLIITVPVQATSTVVVTLSASRATSSSTSLPTATATSDPSVITFYLPAPFLPEADTPVTKIASVSFIGSGVSNGVAVTSYLEERVVEVPATTITTIDGTPVETALDSGSTTTVTGTMVASGQSWVFSAPEYDDYVENCTLSSSSESNESSPSIQCSSQSSSSFGGSFGNALAEYTLTLDSSTSTTTSASPSGSKSTSSDATSIGSDGTPANPTGKSTSSSKSDNGAAQSRAVGMVQVAVGVVGLLGGLAVLV